MDRNIIPNVSVIMGIYNCAGTLEKAVKCIQNQTYDYWELIMCDDCSSDFSDLSPRGLRSGLRKGSPASFFPDPSCNFSGHPPIPSCRTALTGPAWSWEYSR